MGKKQRRLITEAIGGLPENAPRVILATGSYIGEGFDDATLTNSLSAPQLSARFRRLNKGGLAVSGI